MSNGTINQTRFPITTMKVRIPLRSALFGTGIPIDQFRLIPMALLNECKIDIIWNKYAFFSTGYNDIS